MTERISLIEAYDNRDIIAQLVRLRTDVDELINILKDIDPDGDLTNVVTKSGDQTIDGVKTFIGKIVADCDIIQNGAAYETHAEQVFSVNDYIVTRDGQITGIPPGDLSGFHVKKYNGVDDSRLGVDNTGTMRVGDVGSEQPLATRDEVGDMTSGALVKWDGVNSKMIAPSSNVGSDSRPLKQVNGELVPVAADLQEELSVTEIYNQSGVKVVQYGKVVSVSFYGYNPGTTGTGLFVAGNLPRAKLYGYGALFNNLQLRADSYIENGDTNLKINAPVALPFYGSFTYISE